LILHFWPL